MKLRTSLRNTRATGIITDAGMNPKIKFYTGTESLTPAGTPLATLNVTGALGTAASGVITLNKTFTQTNSGHVSGTAAFMLITDSADVAVATVAVGGGLSFTGTITTGVDITPDAPAWTITEGNA